MFNDAAGAPSASDGASPTALLSVENDVGDIDIARCLSISCLRVGSVCIIFVPSNQKQTEDGIWR